MHRIVSRLSEVDAEQLAETIATVSAMGTANPLVPKIRRLTQKDSELFELEELKALAEVLATYALVQERPEGYAQLRDEVTRILSTGC